MRRRFLVGLTVLVALAGCGNRHLVLKVDMLSYLDPSQTAVDVGPVPAIPGGVYSGEQDVVRDVEVNLVDGTGSVAEVRDVSITMTAIVADSTGAGTDTLRLYVSDIDVDPLTTPPAMTMPLTLSPGVTDTVTVELGGDSRVADLFTGRRMRMSLTTAFRGPDSGDPLNARIEIGALNAVLVAGRKGEM
jgi:hypothetical protein